MNINLTFRKFQPVFFLRGLVSSSSYFSYNTYQKLILRNEQKITYYGVIPVVL